MCFKITIKKGTNATAAQLAFALTITLSIKTIKKTGKEKQSKNLLEKSIVNFFMIKKKPKKKIGPNIKACDKTNSIPCKKFIFIFDKLALSDV